MRRRKRLHRREIKRQRKIIILSLFTVLLCFSFGYAAFSTNIKMNAKGNVYKVSDKCYTTLDNGDGTVTIADYDKACGSEVNIPATIRGLTVTRIADGNWDFSCTTGFCAYGPFTNKNITSVTMPDTITYIGDRAFEYNQITKVKLSSNLIKIGFEVFANNKIIEIELPSTLKSIGLGSFSRNEITKINIPSSVTELGAGVFASNNLKATSAIIYGRNSDGSIDYTTLNSYAGKNIDSLIIPSTITTLGQRAFDDVGGTELIVPYTVETIDYACFTNSLIQNIVLEEGVGNIAGSAFWQCNVSHVTIPSSVGKIGENAFYSTPNLKTITINRKENAIDGAPWGSTTATINWTGTN